MVPVGNHYNKPGLIDEKHRYNMLKIATQNSIHLEISDVELNLDKKLMPTEIFEIISKKYKEDEIYFILGADNLYKIGEELRNSYRYIIIKRENFEIPKEILNQGNMKIIENQEYARVSSTIARKLIQEGKDVEKYLPEGVLEYIQDKALYR